MDTLRHHPREVGLRTAAARRSWVPKDQQRALQHQPFPLCGGLCCSAERAVGAADLVGCRRDRRGPGGHHRVLLPRPRDKRRGAALLRAHAVGEVAQDLDHIGGRVLEVEVLPAAAGVQVGLHAAAGVQAALLPLQPLPELLRPPPDALEQRHHSQQQLVRAFFPVGWEAASRAQDQHRKVQHRQAHGEAHEAAPHGQLRRRRRRPRQGLRGPRVRRPGRRQRGRTGRQQGQLGEGQQQLRHAEQP
mmetsp:Transcript_79972/g.226409  ORF Transcript_79972/g.226409 Transcript_79972/m.226409 type:complete len:246 (+) Transcript_79972:976-1713(+)